MPTPEKYLADFNEDSIYHVYNRTSNGQLLFNNDENRLYFLRQYAKYLEPVLDTYCWNLLPNHFHFLVRVKPLNEIKKAVSSKGSQPLKDCLPLAGSVEDSLQGSQPCNGWLPLTSALSKTEKKFLENQITLSELVEHYFRSFFQSYSLALNKQSNKKGNVFYKPFKRIEVNKESHFTQAIIYIHANAQKHKLCKHFTQHRWSSWHTMLSAQPTHLCRQEVLYWFGGPLPFIEAHTGMSEYYYGNDVGIEDD